MNNDRSSQKQVSLSLLAGVLVGIGCVWVGPVWSSEGEGEVLEKVEMAGAAKVTIEQAIKAAIAQVPGRVIEAELEEKPRVTWEVEVVTAEGKVMEILVDVDTGAVVVTKEKKPEKKEEKRRESRRMGEMMHERGGMGMPECCGMGMHQQPGAESK